MNLKASLLDDKAIKRSLIRISHEIIERNKGAKDIILVGIKSRGYPLAERISNEIFKIEGIKVPVGSVDITAYRDDIENSSENIEVKSINLDVSFEGRTIILVDDVLYTCRTVRAAIDAIMDEGRPKAIQLAVLIDRGHKELPIRADYVGKNIPTSRNEKIAVHIVEIDKEDSVKIYDKQIN
ncbi:MAG: bifunctional pyr operon transcriptional regulator/uracil phosphoribosyltransferase PyrR [Clostridium sp.]|nr:bifunctional pyr operon transcriptional regulator/uracil phosphoribosyltransferase PyrR [Clostridium sp.]